MSDKIYVGQKCQTFKNLGEYPPVSRVTMWTDDEHYYTAGDDTGYEISAPCRSATQAIVDAALKQLKGFVYRPFEATGVDIDPAYEPGDAITIGGIYSFIGQDTRRFDAMGLCDISCPGKGEMEDEFPYVSPQDRELKRRVKLGQKYHGVKITRLDGLTVVEMQEDGKEGAKVILNSKKFAFYDADGKEQLYFDPDAGCYKFRGALNVGNKFIVDKLGNVTINGSLTMTGSSNWLMTRYSTNKNASAPDDWQEAWDAKWDNTSTQVWVIYSYNGGALWTAPMLAQGKDGAQGPQGSQANIPDWVKAYTASAQFDTKVTDEWVVSMNLYGSKIFGTEIYGGTITADTTIEVGTDATIGRWLKLKSPTGKDAVGIVFHGDVVGEAPGLWSDNDKFINITANYLGLIGSGLKDSRIGLNTPLLDLTYVSEIEWGNNKPKAYFE